MPVGKHQEGNSDDSARREWMAVLARMTSEGLQSLVDSAAGVPGYRLPRPADVGLCMVRGRMGGTGRRFNFGEATVTRCVVILDDQTTGVAYVLGRDPRKAELAALGDALLQTGRLDAVALNPAREALQQRWRRRADAVASTRVNFFTLMRGED